jgi:hypothetical protein
MNTLRWTYLVWFLAAVSLSLTIIALQPSTVRPLSAMTLRPSPESIPPVTVDIGNAWLGAANRHN